MGLYLVLQSYGDSEGMKRNHGEHVAWIERCTDEGLFLLAGQTEPTGGSVILAEAPTRVAVEALVEEDAFFINGIVTSTEIVEFRPRRGSLRKFTDNPLYLRAT